MKKSVYIFYNLLRYRLLSYFIKGEKQEKYKKKYYSLKSYTDQSERKKISLFGIPCFSVRKLHNITSYEFGGFPVVTTLQKRKKLSFYLFGLRIAKWRTKVLQMKPQSAPVGQPRYDYNKFEALLLNKVQRFLFDITEMAVSFAKNGAKLEDADLALLRQMTEGSRYHTVLYCAQEYVLQAEDMLQHYSIAAHLYKFEKNEWLDGYVYVSKDQELPKSIGYEYISGGVYEKNGLFFQNIVKRTSQVYPSQIINLVWITDKNYLVPTIVSIESVLKHKSDGDKYNVNVVVGSDVEGCDEIKDALESSYANVNVSFILAKENIIPGKTHGHVSSIAMNKFILPSIFGDLDKILYIDSDIFVNSDIKELYAKNIQNYFCAAVKDMAAMTDNWHERICLKDYINSGVMLLNLDKMRKFSIQDILIEYKEKDPTSYFMDQNVINRAFFGNVMYLEPKFNCMLFNNISKGHSIDMYNNFYGTRYIGYEDVVADSICIHATNKYKVWNFKDQLFSSFYKHLYENSIFNKSTLLRMKRNFVHEEEIYTISHVDLADIDITPINVSKKTVPVIISLTSYIKRIHHVHYAVHSLLRQTVRPQKIVLWLGNDQFPNGEQDLPESLLKLKPYGFEVRWCEDMRAFTKLVPSLEAFPDDIVVTADDDIYYPSNWLERLYNSYTEFPEFIHCHRAKVVQTDRPYNEWAMAKADKGSYANFLTGVGGVLYPPHVFSGEVFNKKAWKELTPLNDDIWFWSMAILNGRKIRVVPNCITELTFTDPAQELRLGEKNTLAATNVMEGGNDRQLKAVLDAYSDIERTLWQGRPVVRTEAECSHNMSDADTNFVFMISMNYVSTEGLNALKNFLPSSSIVQTLTGRESYVCVCAGGKIIAEQTHPFVGVKAALTSGGRVFESYAEHIPNKRIIHSCIVDGIRYDLMSAKQGLSCTVFDIENGTFFQKKHFGEIVIQ